MNLPFRVLLMACGDASLTVAAIRAATPEELRSPVNIVFQFKQEGEFSGWPDGSKTSARAYLWVPEDCKKLRGILVPCGKDHRRRSLFI